MKELSIEEKAKRYDEAKYIMEEYLKSGNAGVIAENTIKHAFPELKESEDERIVKELLTFFRESIYGGHILTNKEYDSWIAWLEKQGEQKPAWSKEDENLFRCAIDAVREESKVRTDGCLDEEVGEMVTNWLKSLKERVQPRPKQEWSEEDEVVVKDICDKLNRLSMSYVGNESIVCQEEIKWLKSIIPQSHWKPSDEQMITLRHVISGCSYDIDPLVELETKLKVL